MASAFALDLSLDGVRLLRQDAGGWKVLGGVAIEDPLFDSRLAALRMASEAETGGRLRVELIIPPSQIRYAEIPRPGSVELTDAALRPTLEGLTPLDSEDLVFDWAVTGDMVKLALLDRRTLTEAEVFARAHRFRPIRFTARPEPSEFPRPPNFGATAVAAQEVAAQEDAAPAQPPAPPAETPVETQAETPAPEAPAEAAPEPPAATPPLILAHPAAGPETEEARAEALARTLVAPAPGAEAEALTLQPLRGRADPEALRRRARGRARAVAALVAAALVWAAYFGLRTTGPSDPSAVLPDTPPAVALSVPPMGAPDPLAPPPPTGLRADGDAPALPAPPAAPGRAAPPSRPAAAADAPPAMADANPAARLLARAPSAPPALPESDGEEIYLASIDPVIGSSDAIALPPAVADATRPVAPLPPPPPGTTFAFDEEGQVAATPEGAFTPDGLVVVAAPPPVRPPAAPPRTADLGLTPSAEAAALPPSRPRARPTGLVERNERVRFGGRTLGELGALRPLPRPVSAQATALAAAAEGPSEFALAASPVPRSRPEDFETRAAAARAVALAMAAPAPVPAARGADPAPEDDGEPEVASAAPDIPTSASVARQATIENAIRLRDLNLIGVFGTEGNRRALVRLPSGRYQRVGVGDRLDGGQISAISRNELRYVKGGRNITLTVPSG